MLMKHGIEQILYTLCNLNTMAMNLAVLGAGVRFGKYFKAYDNSS